MVYAYFTTTAIAALFSAIFDLVNMSRCSGVKFLYELKLFQPQTLYESALLLSCQGALLITAIF